MEFRRIYYQYRVDGSVVRVDEVGDKIVIKVGGEEEMVGGGDEIMIGDINGI